MSQNANEPVENSDASSRPTEPLDTTGADGATEPIYTADAARPTEPIDTSNAARPTEPISRLGVDQPAGAPQDRTPQDPTPQDRAPGAADLAQPPAPAPNPIPTPAPIKNTVPLGTLIFGLIVFLLGALMLANQYLNIVVNPAFVTVSILIGAGLIMVVGGISAARRNSSADRTNMKG